MYILDMFDICSRPTIMKSMVESADSGLELADSSVDSNVDLAKVCVWYGPSSKDYQIKQ